MKPTTIKLFNNEVNIIETNSNKKKKKKHAARSCRHNKVILADRNIYHKPCLHIHQHFRSISSSTMNLQILTKKKQIKVPNDGNGDEA